MIFVIYFTYIFFTNNYEFLYLKFWDKSEGPNSIGFINQKQAINWIYEDAGNKNFNVDVYVPPVIPYAYDYLFKWNNNKFLVKENVELLYLLYEHDPDHQERLDVWMARQKKIGKVLEQKKFGAITVERRLRL